MKPFIRTIAIALLAVAGVSANTATAAEPTCTIREVTQRPGTQLVDVTYDLQADAGADVAITMEYSVDGGNTWSDTAISISTTAGQYKHLTWNAGADWPDGYTEQARIKLFAPGGGGPVPGRVVFYTGAGQNPYGGVCGIGIESNRRYSFDNDWSTYSGGGNSWGSGTHGSHSVMWEAHYSIHDTMARMRLQWKRQNGHQRGDYNSADDFWRMSCWDYELEEWVTMQTINANTHTSLLETHTTDTIPLSCLRNGLIKVRINASMTSVPNGAVRMNLYECILLFDK